MNSARSSGVVLRRRALLVFLTPLDDPALAESFVRNVDLIRQHLVLVNMLQPLRRRCRMSHEPGRRSLSMICICNLGGHFALDKPCASCEVLQRLRRSVLAVAERTPERGTGVAISGGETEAADMRCEVLDVVRLSWLDRDSEDSCAFIPMTPTPWVHRYALRQI